MTEFCTLVQFVCAHKQPVCNLYLGNIPLAADLEEYKSATDM